MKNNFHVVTRVAEGGKSIYFHMDPEKYCEISEHIKQRQGCTRRRWIAEAIRQKMRSLGVPSESEGQLTTGEHRYLKAVIDRQGIRSAFWVGDAVLSYYEQQKKDDATGAGLTQNAPQ